MMNVDQNQSSEITFILLGFSDYPYLQGFIFFVFLVIYVVTVIGNLMMIFIIWITPKLHTPMYFFLSNLSFVDFCYSTTITPKLLEILVVEDRAISFLSCITQVFLTATCVVTEAVWLAVMAYNRFVAICNPLLYTVMMSQKIYILLVTVAYSWEILLLSSIAFTYSLLVLSFCRTNIINNFFCEYSTIFSASFSDKQLTEIILFSLTNFNTFSTLLIILTSYLFIVVTIMKMPSTSGRHKAFSTCASHFTAVIIFYGAILFLYCVPNSKSSWLLIRISTAFYSVVIPMLNPLIYSLRNKDVKETVKKLMDHKICSQ
ncbi:olfactory receptor 5D18-like [Sarcophilus harrisii]|uniref:olfactory receptor 5D18-like n=1 Tax=Sarcophilus harrisii TaxID=9305 RepID=UPI000273C7D3|nr:olfactory receptor 5D18-like [Sarcophilus harrisii]